MSVKKKNEIKPKTDEEIKRQIEGLTKMRLDLPRRSSFGDDNWGKIDAQIAVLKGERTPDYYYVDEHSDDYRDCDNDTWSDAELAQLWKEGRQKGDLFDS